MIHITLNIRDQKICSLSCNGHANAAPYGEDLVCAGISSIMTGALNGIDMLFPEACDLRMQSDRISIQVNRSTAALQSVLAFLEIQLETVQASYPEFIKMEKKEV